MKNAIIGIFTIVAVVAVALSARCDAQTTAAGNSLAGNWLGTLNAGGTELRLVLHMVAARDGSLTATIDSLDQGVNNIPVTSVTLKDTKLSLVIDAVHGTYDGTVNKDASAIDGTWTQGQPLALTFKRVREDLAVAPAPKPAPPSDIDGTWVGILDAGPEKLHVAFKIVNTAAGLTATFQSTDQSPVWLTASSVARSGSAVTISLNGIGVRYEGKIGADLYSIDGTFLQAGNALPLVLTRVKDQAK
jgi:hypothetical protein